MDNRDAKTARRATTALPVPHHITPVQLARIRVRGVVRAIAKPAPKANTHRELEAPRAWHVPKEKRVPKGQRRATTFPRSLRSSPRKISRIPLRSKASKWKLFGHTAYRGWA